MQGALPLLVKCMQSSLLKQAKMAFLQQLIRLDRNRSSSDFTHFLYKIRLKSDLGRFSIFYKSFTPKYGKIVFR